MPLSKCAHFCRASQTQGSAHQCSKHFRNEQAVQTRQCSEVERLFLLTWTHFWRTWSYANRGLLKPRICPDKNISAFLPLPWGHHWCHLSEKTWISCIRQQSSARNSFLDNLLILPEQSVTEDIRPLQTRCCKIQQLCSNAGIIYLWSLRGQPSKSDLSRFSLRWMWRRMLLFLSAAEFSSARRGKHSGRNALFSQTRTC